MQSLTSAGAVSITSWVGGHVLRRVHCAIHCTLGCPQGSPTSNISSFELGVGIETVLSTTTPVPTPLANPVDHNPPTERWLHWRVVHFTGNLLATPTNSLNSVYVGDTPLVDLDIQAPVAGVASAPLSLSVAWEPSTLVASDWHIRLAWWASVLTS